MNFKNPIHLKVLSSDDPITFASLVELQVWLDEQHEAWKSHASGVADVAGRLPQALGWIQEHVRDWQNISTSVKKGGDPSQGSEDERERLVRERAGQLQKWLNDGKVLWVGHDVASRAIALADDQPDASLWLLLFALGRAKWYLVSNDNSAYWSAFSSALAHLADPKSASLLFRRQRAATAKFEEQFGMLSSALDETRADLAARAAEFNKLLADVRDEGASHFAAVNEHAVTQRSDISDEWKKLRATYDAELKLRAPREYWNLKRTEHEQIAGKWRLAFALTAAAAAVLIGLAVASLASGFIEIPDALGAWGWILPAAVLGVPAFLSLWLLRLCGRQWSDHLMRREDARERVVMVETFLAISRDQDSPGAVTDPAQLGLVLNAIFRAGPGLVVDDSPPAGFFEAVLARVNSGKG